MPAKAPKTKAPKTLPVESAGTSPQEDVSSTSANGTGAVLALPALLNPPITFYGARHIEMRLTAEQSRKVTALMYSLMHQGEEIQRAPDALRWLIDQLPSPEEAESES